MNRLTKAALGIVAVVMHTSGVLTVAACDSGVPPRHQADTRDYTSPMASSGVTPNRSSPQSDTGLAAFSDTDSPTAPNTEPKLEYTPLPVPGGTKPEASTAPVFDPERVCRNDTECALVPDDCTQCPPCEATWRRAANRAVVNRIVKTRQATPCPPIACVQCSFPTLPGQPPEPHGYLGSSAECQAGQCVVK